jgi:hypothetical protein
VTCAPFSCCTSLHAPQVFRAADDVIAHVRCWMEVGWDDVSHVYTHVFQWMEVGWDDVSHVCTHVFQWMEMSVGR